MHATAQPKKETPNVHQIFDVEFRAAPLGSERHFTRYVTGFTVGIGHSRQRWFVKVESVYGFGETITRLEADIAKKGIMFFLAVDQSQLGADAGIKLKPSTLLIFGNPPLGIQFLTSNPDSGLDWPVRLLVRQDDDGHVWAVYTDFSWIAKRHGITDRKDQFKMASDVIASITSSVTSKP